MTTALKGAESQMNSVSAMLIHPDSIVPFQTQCEPFRCRRPRGFEARARGAQRVPAPPAIWPRVPGRAQPGAVALPARAFGPRLPGSGPHPPRRPPPLRGGVDSVKNRTVDGEKPKKIPPCFTSRCPHRVRGSRVPASPPKLGLTSSLSRPTRSFFAVKSFVKLEYTNTCPCLFTKPSVFKNSRACVCLMSQSKDPKESGLKRAFRIQIAFYFHF